MNSKTANTLSLAKRIAFAAISLCLLLSCAIGESLPSNAVVYEHPNDPLTVYSFTPLDDGSVVLAGQLRHKGQYRDMPDNMSYETKEMESLNDAAAVCLAPDGTKRWEIRLADPQAENMFYCQGLLPDGRLLITFRALDSKSFGSHNFIVSRDGIVEEMLPTKKIAETASPHGIWLMSGGFLSDGSRYVDDIYGTEYPTEIIMRDFGLNELWRYDYQNGTQIVHIDKVMEVSEGYIITLMGVNDHFTHYDYSILKLDCDGMVLWQVPEIPSYHGFCFEYACEDGGLLFSGRGDPWKSEADDEPVESSYPTLTKLDDDGNHLWSIRFDDEIKGIGHSVMMGDGYVLTGSMSEYTMIHEYVLLYVDSEGKTVGRLPITGDDGLVPWWPSLVKDKNGGIYVFANLAEPVDMESRLSGDVKKFFYAKIDENSFK